MSISFYNSEMVPLHVAEETKIKIIRERRTVLKSVQPLFFWILVPAFLLILIYNSNIDGAVDLFHEGESITASFETARGKVPFRDIYLQHGWGVNLLRGKLAFLFFGDSLAAHRRLLFGESGYLVPITWVCVYFLLYAVFRRKIWILPAFVLLACADVMVNDRHLLPFLSMAFMAWGIWRPRPASFLSGALAAVAIFYSLDTGIYAMAIGAAFLVLYGFGSCSRNWRIYGMAAGDYFSGAIVAAIPFLSYLLWHGILDDFIRNSLYQVRYQSETWGIAPPSLLVLFGPFENAVSWHRALYLAIKWYYPVLIYLLSALLLLPMIIRHSLTKREAPMLLSLLAGIIFFASALGRADEPHLMYAITPFWILNLCILEWAITQAFSDGAEDATLYSMSPYISAGLITVISVGLGLYFYATCRNGGLLQNRLRLESWERSGKDGFVSLDIRRAGGILVPAQQASEIKEMVAFIESHTQPEEPIFDFSNQGAYYFLAGRTNSTMFSQAAYAMPPLLQARAVEQLQKSPPALVIMRENAAYGPMEREPLIYNWIQQRYEEAGRIGSNSIFLPLSLEN